MKKLFTLLLLFAAIATANSAVVLREDFEGGKIPDGWTVYSTVQSNCRWRVEGSIRNGKSPLKPYELGSGHFLAGIPAVSSGNYNEWLVSPEITIPVTQQKNVISFETFYKDASSEMTLRWFESDTSKAVILWTATGVNEYDKTVEVDISKYNGKKGHFAWVFRRVAVSDIDGSGWGIDLIKAETVINGVDLEPVEFLSPMEHLDLNMYTTGKEIPVKVKVCNNGRIKASGYKISYTFEGNTVTEAMGDIDSAGFIEYQFTKGLTVTKASNSNTVSVSVQTEKDEVPSNNTLKVNNFWVSGPASVTQDFENVSPGEWSLAGFVTYNMDNVTDFRNVSDGNFFRTDAWTAGTAGGTVAKDIWGFRLAFTSSDFASTASACDRWLVFPKVRISSAPTFLQWDAASANTMSGTGTENYEILISTKSNALADFTKVHEVTKEKRVNPNDKNQKPSTRYIDLSSYKGKDIYIAFRDVTGGNERGMLLLDNVKFLGENVIYSGVKEIASIRTRLYPNPATDFICVEAEEPVTSVILYNALGQKVYENHSVDAELFHLPTASLSNGVYFIRVNTANGTAMEKISVAR
ncbi:MAG: choice-of-anchor J domain-containing protein [Bacteroidales bacterium]|nr:choice-of-anchor J domain-containing protein [Bacteroidales bacterium]